MDPFEARLQYIQLLEALNPSILSINKAVQFALKNAELHEDFHSCILEVLDKLDTNSKMKVLYYIQELISVILSQFSDPGRRPYLKNFEQNFHLILEKAIPNYNLTNLRDSVEILINIEKMYNIDNTKLRKFYFNLNYSSLDYPLPDFEDDGFALSWKFLINNKINGIRNRAELLSNKGSDLPNTESFSKEQILNRIEHDRERHKRVKEVSWAISRPSANSSNVLKNSIDSNEFDKLWQQYSSLKEEDYQELKELQQNVRTSYNQTN